MQVITPSAILEGRHRCIYGILNFLRAKSGAESVCVVHEEDGRWKVAYEVLARPGAGFSYGIPDAVAQGLNASATRATPWWHQPASIGKAAKWVLVTQVVFRQMVPNTIRTHFVIFVAPVWICPSEPDMGPNDFYAIWARRLVSCWFAWVSYAREERRRYCRESMKTKPDKLPPSIRKTLPWPVPFQEVIELIEAGWVPNDHKHNAKWLSDVLEEICLSQQGKCCCRAKFDPPPCQGNSARKDFESAARFIRWRFPVSQGDSEEVKRAIEDLAKLDLAGNDPVDPKRSAARRLDGKALLRFFADVFWRQWLPRRQEFGLGQDDQERCIRSCTFLVHHLMAGVPIDEQTIEAMVWAISRYAHDVLGVESRLDIASHLLQSARSEPALHVLKQYYRDHFFHALEVCFLGHRLLVGATMPSGRRLIDLCRDILRAGSAEEVLREWYVAALFHDVGYTMEILRGVQDALAFYKRSKDLAELAANIDNLVKDFSGKLVARGFQGFTSEDHPGEDHGVVGAVHLASLLEHIGKRKGRLGSYGPAIRAIAVHNHRRKTVRFSDEPLSFLLVLCDAIQEWNRPHLFYSTAAATMLTRLYHGGEIEELRGPLGSAILVLPEATGTVGATSDEPIQFELRYIDAINDNAGVFHMWLDLSSNLQRLEVEGFPFEVTLRFVTPHFGKGGRPGSQMDRLKEAAHETHMNFLADWFPKDGNDAIQHTSDDQERLDKLELHLRALTLSRPVSATMKTFFRLLSHWSRFNEDRVFAGDYAPEPPG
jgi:hypothetical protein